MRVEDYQDILWDFIVAGRSDSVALRVFSREDELFQADANEQPERTFSLPAVSREFADLRARWRSDAGAARDLGRAMWKWFPEEVTRPLLSGNPSRPVRLKISSFSSALTDLPWEWLSPQDGPPLALRDGVRLVRSVPARLGPPPLTVTLPLRVLLVLTNPNEADRPLLQPHKEVAAVSSQIRLPHYELHQCPGSSEEAILKAFKNVQPHVVHYVGYAAINHDQGALVFDDPRGHTTWLNPAQAAGLLPASARLCCFSTCVTGGGADPLGLTRMAHSPEAAGMPTAVANQTPLSEASARAFWGAFYAELIAQQGNVNEAGHRARRAVAASSPSSADWASFVVVLRDQTGRPFSFDGEREATARRAAELQALFAARLVNDLAERVRDAAGARQQLRERLTAETERAVNLAKEINPEKPSP